MDTAGLRESEDAVEREGVERTRRHLATADLVLRVVDGSLPPVAEPVVAEGPGVLLLVLNKADLGIHRGWSGHQGMEVSCRTGAGMEGLEARIYEVMGVDGGAAGTELVAVNARHQDALRLAQAGLEIADRGLADGLAPEFVAVDLRTALDALGEIVGRVDAEDLLSRIFANFCIGK